MPQQQSLLGFMVTTKHPRDGKENRPVIICSSDDDAPIVQHSPKRSRYADDEAVESSGEGSSSDNSDDSFVVSDHNSDIMYVMTCGHCVFFTISAIGH